MDPEILPAKRCRIQFESRGALMEQPRPAGFQTLFTARSGQVGHTGWLTSYLSQVAFVYSRQQLT